ncbi:ATP-binding protein [Bacillus sp. 3255]|uniref:sensor histidine kinase n=1 Tax=Bacillus sp. 3255 TaxID=2817904 RepID=UPI0028586BF2|nr:ATP-binding protein [Bacillus sp. 3255]MDR6884663.1 signal transduction histidine kinase [Bacillus sp. 3255]
MLFIRTARWVVAFISALCAALYAYAVPLFFREMRDRCAVSECRFFYNPPPGMEWLDAHGLTPTAYASAYTWLYVLFSLLFFAAGAVLFAYKRGDAVGLLGTLTLIICGATFIPVMDVLKEAGPVWRLAVQMIGALGMVGFMLFCGTFPNGKFSPPWTGWLLGAIMALRIPGMLAPGTWADLQQFTPLFHAWFVGWICSLIVLVVYRYRLKLSPTERLQTKWAVYGFVIALGGLAGWSAVYLLNQQAWVESPYLMYVLEIGVQMSMCVIPVTLLVALLRYRLWNIDPLVNRTVVYGLLTLCIIALYGGTVGYLSLLFQTSGSWFVSFAATGLVAVLFHPLRVRLQRAVDRWMYGERGDPVATLADLGERLAKPLKPEEALFAVARSVREALRLSYTGISVGVGTSNAGFFQENGNGRPVAEDGEVPEDVRRVPLVHRGEQVGELHLPALPRTGADPDRDGLAEADRRFLELLSRHAGAIVHGVQATYAVQQLAADLQESRERLVLAREDERRRLRHNLHDDLAPRLAALLYTSAAAEMRVDTEPNDAKSMIAELRGHIRRTIADIRTLVYDLRPPALDELGLIGAIRERIADLSGSAVGAPQLRIELDAPEALPPLPAAVEVAAYRIATEALVNVAKHASATRCAVTLRTVDGKMELTISDNGVGAASAERPPQLRIGGGGLGQVTMRERAAELGGDCRIERPAQGGTIVSAWLPLKEEEPAIQVKPTNEGVAS